MALIDVTELLSDPDFIDPVSIVSRTPIINNFGENTLNETSIQTVGSVQPASGKALQRLPQDLQISDMSSFWVKAEIAVNEPGKYTDVLVFKSRRYQVVTVFQWSNWGAGYSEGLCVAEKPS